MTLPSSGPISLGQIQSEFGLGNNLGVYRGTLWFTDQNRRGYFDGAGSGNNAPIDISEFYGKRKTSPATSGSQSFASSTSYTLPLFNTLKVTCWGASGGGGGGGADKDGYTKNGSDGTAGGSSSVSGLLSAQGGGKGNGGQGGLYPSKPPNGTDGSGSDHTRVGGAGGNGGNHSADGSKGGDGGTSSATWDINSNWSYQDMQGQTYSINIGSKGLKGNGASVITPGGASSTGNDGVNGVDGYVLIEWWA